MIRLWWEMKLISINNSRRGRWSMASLAKIQRQRALLEVANKIEQEGLPPGPPYKIIIVRHGKRKLDSDNLAASAKFVRDGVADALGIDDGDDSLATWHYMQEPGQYMVEVILDCRAVEND